MPGMFKANERCYNRTLGLYGLETLNHRSELKILWNTFRSQNFGFHMIAGWQTIADDRRIAGDRRSVFPYDRRRSQNVLRSAIVCDHMETSLYAPHLRHVYWSVVHQLYYRCVTLKGPGHAVLGNFVLFC